MSRRRAWGGFIVGIVATVVSGLFVLVFTVTSPPSLCHDNLLSCSNPVAILVPNKSSSSFREVGESVEVTFDNISIGSGVAFQLEPERDVRDFGGVQIEGESSQPFHFEVEYKRKAGGNELQKAETSARHTLPAGKNVVNVPLAYDGMIAEVVLNFYQAKESSTLRIDSIRVVPSSIRQFGERFSWVAFLGSIVGAVIAGVYPLLTSYRLERKLRSLIGRVEDIGSKTSIDLSKDAKLALARQAFEASNNEEFETLVKKPNDFKNEVERQKRGDLITEGSSKRTSRLC